MKPGVEEFFHLEITGRIYKYSINSVSGVFSLGTVIPKIKIYPSCITIGVNAQVHRLSGNENMYKPQLGTWACARDRNSVIFSAIFRK